MMDDNYIKRGGELNKSLEAANLSESAEFTGSPTYLLTMIRAGLKNAERIGSDKDEPEGCRYIQISDTFAKDICAKIDKLIG